MKKVNLDVIRPWISNRITELIGLEDEVVIDYTCSLLEEKVIINITLLHLASSLIKCIFLGP
jgi:hypothetical protein